jgi:hypothetical protein
MAGNRSQGLIPWLRYQDGNGHYGSIGDFGGLSQDEFAE